MGRALDRRLRGSLRFRQDHPSPHQTAAEPGAGLWWPSHSQGGLAADEQRADPRDSTRDAGSQYDGDRRLRARRARRADQATGSTQEHACFARGVEEVSTAGPPRAVPPKLEEKGWTPASATSTPQRPPTPPTTPATQPKK